MTAKYTANAELAGQRLDSVLAQLAGISRHQAQRRIREGLVMLEGQHVVAKHPVAAGDVIELAAEPSSPIPAAPRLTVLYEDGDMMVVDKPAGLAVHASESGRPQSTVAAFAAAQGVKDDDIERPGIVHRLDKDTSGAMVIAKHPDAKEYLQKLFKSRQVEKYYLALVRGRLQDPEAVIKLPIGRHRRQPVKRAVVPGSREAITRYKTVATYPGATLVEIELHTGRTHQIRVHFSHLGHPVIGDTLYGDAKPPAGLTRQFLHAARLCLTAPSGRTVDISSPLPPELQDYLGKLKKSV